uniref:TolC family protein n=1 Tax=Schlesneria paludicola TaxID=360056 RepID=A0A7C2JZS8_9PLAN
MTSARGSLAIVSQSCVFAGLLVGVLPGCQTARQQPVVESTVIGTPVSSAPEDERARSRIIEPVSLEVAAGPSDGPGPEPGSAASDAVPGTRFVESLPELEAYALSANPTLRRMQQEAAAAWDKTRYVAALPDPSVGSTFFVPPMNFEPDRQVADLQLMQMIPWLSRLKAEAQRACFEALAAENLYHAERLRVVGDLRATWFKYYVLNKQIETTLADQSQLESLIKTANARVATGDAQPGDVLLATLELTSLQEQLISYRQQIVATNAELNRLLGRDAAIAIQPPSEIAREFPDWDHGLLKAVALESQPEVAAARLRTAATRWGVEVARLQRRPDLTFGVGWVFMDAPGATMSDAGRDSLMLGVSTTLPLSRSKYEAMLSQATRENHAAHASMDEIVVRLDAQLRDLWEQAQASHETVQLYERSILPQARQTFEADLQALANNSVTFDRVVRDYRTVLNLELGLHRALGQQAITLARIRQTVGTDLVVVPPALPPSAAP